MSSDQLENLPTVSRSLEDFARTSPYFSPIAVNAEPGALSVAGRNNRYNSIQIDGAVNNDLFGLSATGAPAGQTESQPISLDAIEELQLLVVALRRAAGRVLRRRRQRRHQDRHQHASAAPAYFFGRSESFVGDYTDPITRGTRRCRIGAFSEKLGGGSVGGPIAQQQGVLLHQLRDRPARRAVRLLRRRQRRASTSAASPEANRILNMLKNRYSYDPGGLDRVHARASTTTSSSCAATSTSAPNHRLTARHNYIDATNDIGRLQPDGVLLPGLLLPFPEQDELDRRAAEQHLRPHVQRASRQLPARPRRPRRRHGVSRRCQIELGSGAGGGLFRVGREQSSTANELDQDIIEMTDDFTMQLGAHTVTLGTHNEIFDFRNLFIQNSFGFYTLHERRELRGGLRSGIRVCLSNTSDPLQPAKFGVRQFSLYAGDQWRARPSLTLTYGVRLDAPMFPDTPTRQPGDRTGVRHPHRRDARRPRSGRRASASTTTSVGGVPQQVRGGVGIFSGRTPYVWLSNQYTGTGLEFTRPVGDVQRRQPDPVRGRPELTSRRISAPRR